MSMNTSRNDITIALGTPLARDLGPHAVTTLAATLDLARRALPHITAAKHIENLLTLGADTFLDNELARRRDKDAAAAKRHNDNGDVAHG